MREYLFRGFSPSKEGKKCISFMGEETLGEWMYGRLTESRYYSKILTCIVSRETGTDEIRIYRVLPETVGEWIGKEDIDGNKIFEGDIVAVIPANGETGVVEYDEENAKYIVRLTGGGERIAFDRLQGKDVICVETIYSF